jgi:hypothetical protein
LYLSVTEMETEKMVAEMSQLRVPKYVVVTATDNGVIHAWGDSHGVPFLTRGQAKHLVAKMKRSDAELYGPEKAAGIVYRTCEIKGDGPHVR